MDFVFLTELQNRSKINCVALRNCDGRNLVIFKNCEIANRKNAILRNCESVILTYESSKYFQFFFPFLNLFEINLKKLKIIKNDLNKSLTNLEF